MHPSLIVSQHNSAETLAANDWLDIAQTMTTKHYQEQPCDQRAGNPRGRIASNCCGNVTRRIWGNAMKH